MALTLEQRLRARYEAMLADPDPRRRALARTSLDKLTAMHSAAHLPRPEPDQPAPWAHVLCDLVTQSGNQLIDRGGGAEVKSGHEPLHSSASGTCVSINREKGLWWCSACQRGGTAISWVQDTRNLAYTSACSWLNLRYGAASG
jgi:hypothetical protein